MIQTEEIFNYEAPQGVYSVPNSDNTGWDYDGQGIGYKQSPGWSSGSSAIEGGRAYFSDMYSKDLEMNGSAPYNKRLRWSLTLDKKIFINFV